MNYLKEESQAYLIFIQFGCTCYIMKNKVHLKKFHVKAQKGIFLGYYERSKAYRVYNSETIMVEEYIHFKFNDEEPDYNMLEPVQIFADIPVSEDHPEVGPSEVGRSKAGIPKVGPNF